MIPEPCRVHFALIHLLVWVRFWHVCVLACRAHRAQWDLPIEGWDGGVCVSVGTLLQTECLRRFVCRHARQSVMRGTAGTEGTEGRTSYVHVHVHMSPMKWALKWPRLTANPPSLGGSLRPPAGLLFPTWRLSFYNLIRGGSKAISA